MLPREVAMVSLHSSMDWTQCYIWTYIFICLLHFTT